MTNKIIENYNAKKKCRVIIWCKFAAHFLKYKNVWNLVE